VTLKQSASLVGTGTLGAFQNDIRKYFLQTFLRKRPIVQIFRGVQNTRMVFNDKFTQISNIFGSQWLKIRKKLVFGKFDFHYGPIVLFLTNFLVTIN
jgi:hypothetical protein